MSLFQKIIEIKLCIIVVCLVVIAVQNYRKARKEERNRRRVEYSNQLYKEIIFNSNEAIAILSPKGKYKEQNLAHQKLFGYSNHDLIGDTPIVCLREIDYNKIWSTIDKKTYKNELIAKTKEGNLLDLELSAFLLRNQNGKPSCVVFIARDISLKKQVEQGLINNLKELQKVNELKDDFISTVSHELRTPITNIKLAASMLATLTKENSNTQQCIEGTSGDTFVQAKFSQYIEIIKDESDREVNLINDLLDMQQLESGTKQVKLDVINLETWLPKQIKPFIERIRQRNIKLKTHLDSKISPFLFHVSSLERILTELLNNACKYTPPNEEIQISFSKKFKILILEVTNTGAVIPPTELPYIFNSFYRGSSNDKWRQGGTGLGLSLVKKLVEHLNGTIVVTSSHGRTRFNISFPVN